MALFTVMGASGFIGGALAAFLREQGHDVQTPARDADLPARPGHVIYAIGLTADFRHRPFATSHAHVGRLTDFLEQGGAESFLYLSSTRVYQGANSTHESSDLRAAPLDPGHVYNLTKLAGEALVLNCGQPGARVVRLSSVVGPSESQRDTFLGAMAKGAADGHIRVQSSPASAKDYVWVGDVLPLLQNIALSGVAPIYNVASGRQTRHDDWLAGIARLTGARVEFAADAPDAGFQPIDISRLSAEFSPAFCNPLDHLPAILSATPAP